MLNLSIARPVGLVSFSQWLVRVLFTPCLVFGLLPSPLVWAQTVAGTSPAAQGEAEARTLKLGEPVERELAGGQQHAYQITSSAGQYLNVVVEQRGIDVAVVLLGPDGKQLFEFDNERRNQGPETVWHVAEVSGSFRLSVRATQKEAPAGRYEIRLVELRAATEQDRTLQEARKLYAEGDRLWRANKYDEARPLIERSLEMREQALGTEHPDVAQSLNRLATIYSGKGDDAKAEPLHQRALVIWEKALGPDHPDVSVSLNNLARLYRDKGDFAKAESLYQRALAIREKALGLDHTNVADVLNRLGDLYRRKGDFAKAEPLYQRALAIREKALGTEHPDVAGSLINLANLYYRKGDFAKAEPLYQRSLAIREKALGTDHAETLALVSELATVAKSKGELARAESLLQRILAAKEKTFGPEDSQIIAPLLELGSFYTLTKVDLAKAELLIRRALAICEKKLPPDHDDFVGTLDSLASLCKEKADYVQAESLYRRVLAIREKKKGPEDMSVGFAAWMLASVHLAKAELNEAEALYRRALAILEKIAGKENPLLYGILNDTALVYLSKGDFAQAEPLFQRALVASEKAYGPENSGLIYPLSNLALISFMQRDFAREEQLRQRVLAITEKTFGPAHPQFASALIGMAGIYLVRGEYTRAEPLLQRALMISEKAYGPEHPQVAGAIAAVSGLYLAQGDYVKAMQVCQRALTIIEKTFGSEHFNTVQYLNPLIEANRLQGDMPQAIALMTRGNDIIERSLDQYLVGGSERQKLALLSTIAPQVARTIALHTLSAPNDPAALKLALTTLLQRKGRGQDVMADAIAQLRRRATPEDQKLLNQLADARSKLATATLKGPGKDTPDAYRAQLKQLTEQSEKLESEISARNAEFRVQTQPVTLAAVQAAITSGTALVEFAFYVPPPPNITMIGSGSVPARYVAYVLHPQGEAQWVELGEAKVIDDAVEKLRQALRDKRRRDVKQLARAVDEKVLRPVRALLGQTRRVFISPDGALNLIPFAALVDEHNRYLVQRYDFSYLTSGRDLLRLQVKQPNKQTAMFVANPDFGEAANAGAARQRGLVYRPGTKAATGEGAVLAGYYFPPLQGTAGEARALKAMLTDAIVLTQGQATEAALKQVSGPRILHIATHGFFLENQKPAVVEERGLKLVSMEEPTVVGQIENPLLRSGLALAGANRPTSGTGDDGILTAQEAAGLDLWGTKLVVLSACDTGVGEVKNGEGVYGLRRALVLAGSETQVMSLWPVSDKATRDLMIEYYRRLLLRGEGRSAALRQVQLQLLAGVAARGQKPARDYSHPYYWASFIQSGEWANLAGNR